MFASVDQRQYGAVAKQYSRGPLHGRRNDAVQNHDQNKLRGIEPWSGFACLAKGTPQPRLEVWALRSAQEAVACVRSIDARFPSEVSCIEIPVRAATHNPASGTPLRLPSADARFPSGDILHRDSGPVREVRFRIRSRIPVWHGIRRDWWDIFASGASLRPLHLLDQRFGGRPGSLRVRNSLGLSIVDQVSIPAGGCLMWNRTSASRAGFAAIGDVLLMQDFGPCDAFVGLVGSLWLPVGSLISQRSDGTRERGGCVDPSAVHLAQGAGVASGAAWRVRRGRPRYEGGRFVPEERSDEGRLRVKRGGWVGEASAATRRGTRRSPPHPQLTDQTHEHDRSARILHRSPGGAGSLPGASAADILPPGVGVLSSPGGRSHTRVL